MLISYAHTIKNMYNMTRSFENIIDTEKILCDFSFQNSYMYSSNKQELKNIKVLMNLVESIISLEKLNLNFYEDNRDYHNIVEILENIAIKLNKYKDINIIFNISNIMSTCLSRLFFSIEFVFEFFIFFF